MCEPKNYLFDLFKSFFIYQKLALNQSYKSFNLRFLDNKFFSYRVKLIVYNKN